MRFIENILYSMTPHGKYSYSQEMLVAFQSCSSGAILCFDSPTIYVLDMVEELNKVVFLKCLMHYFDDIQKISAKID